MLYSPESLNSEKMDLLLLSIVLPRPIALVTSLNKDAANTNIAPFSLFNLVSLDPPIIFISIQKTDPPKRTALNIIRAKEFVVNIPNYSIAEQMNKAAMPYCPNEENKFIACKLTKTKSQKLETPSIKESLIRLECKLHSLIDLGGYEMFMGKIQCIYCDNSILEDHQVSINKHNFIVSFQPDAVWRKLDELAVTLFTFPHLRLYVEPVHGLAYQHRHILEELHRFRRHLVFLLVGKVNRTEDFVPVTDGDNCQGRESESHTIAAISFSRFF